MNFFEGARVLAVQARSEMMARMPKKPRPRSKPTTLWQTLVIWDGDLLSDEILGVVKVYRVNDPKNPRVYWRGDIGEAEPSAPNWTVPVNDLFQQVTLFRPQGGHRVDPDSLPGSEVARQQGHPGKH